MRHQHVTIWGSIAHGNLGDRLLLDAAATTVSQATRRRAAFVCARGAGSGPTDVTTYRILPAPRLLRCHGFVVAGGTHVHDHGSFGLTAAPFRPLLAAVALGTPGVLLSVGMETSRAADGVVAHVAEVCSLVTVRDEDSFSRLRRHRPRVRRTRDLVEEVLTADAVDRPLTAQRTYIAFAPSADLLTRTLPVVERDRMLTQWIERMRTESATSGATSLVLASSDQDRLLAQDLAPDVEVRSLQGLDLDAARAALQDVAHLYSMRFHVAVLARSLAVPVTTIGDDPKLRSLSSPEDDEVVQAGAGDVLSGKELVQALHVALATPPTARQRVRAVIMLTKVLLSLGRRPGTGRHPRLPGRRR